MTLVKDPGRVADLAARMQSGELPPAALLEQCLARIDAVEGDVAGWREIDRTAARASASTAGRAGSTGPLHGVPVAVKDVIDVAGYATRAGSRSRAQIPPATADAEVVARLRTAGAVILGKKPYHRVCAFLGTAADT